MDNRTLFFEGFVIMSVKVLTPDPPKQASSQSANLLPLALFEYWDTQVTSIDDSK